MPNSPEREDRRRMRFNNSIAPLLLGPAPPAFGLGGPGGGWAPAGMVAVEAGVALADFCASCFLYHPLHLFLYHPRRQPGAATGVHFAEESAADARTYLDHSAWPDADVALFGRLAPLDWSCCLSGIAAAASPPPAVQQPILP
jgi:hypothetical protein